MSGLNDDVEQHDVDTESFLKTEAEQTASAPSTQTLGLLATPADTTTGTEIVKAIDDFNVDVVTLNNEAFEVDSLGEIVQTINGEKAIAQETILNIAKLNEGRFKYVVETIEEQVSPVAGFTKEPSSVNYRRTIDVVGQLHQEKQASLTGHIEAFIAEKKKAVADLMVAVSTPETGLFSKVIKDIDRLQVKALDHAGSTAKNREAFVIRWNSAQEDSKFTVTDLRALSTHSYNLTSLPYPTLLNVGFSDPSIFSTIGAYLETKQHENSTKFSELCTHQGCTWQEDTFHSSIRQSYLKPEGVAGLPTVAQTAFSYNRFISIFASNSLQGHFENVMDSLIEAFKGVSERDVSPEHHRNIVSGYETIVSRIQSNVVMAMFITDLVKLVDILFDQFKLAEQSYNNR